MNVSSSLEPLATHITDGTSHALHGALTFRQGTCHLASAKQKGLAPESQREGLGQKAAPRVLYVEDERLPPRLGMKLVTKVTRPHT